MYIISFLMTLTFLSFNINSMADTYQTENVPFEIVLQEIEKHKSEAKKLVSEFSKEHEEVLNQFDLFAASLEDAYLAGEGLIHKDVHRIYDAVAFAAEKHRNQTRKDPLKTPYIIHPIGVAHLLLTVGRVRNPDTLIGALLHDTVEDTETSFDEVESAFGKPVADLVREVTDNKSLPKEVRKQLQIEHAPHKSAGAASIKLADKLYNLRDILREPPADWEQERIEQYFRWAKAVVDHLPWVNAPLKKAIDHTIDAFWKNESLSCQE